MKQPINEIKRMQLIAGLITESEYQEARLTPASDDEGEETRRAGKAAGDLFRLIGNMGDVDSITSLIKAFVNKKYPELRVKITGFADNMVDIYSKNPRSKVVNVQVGGDGIWEVYVSTDKSRNSEVQEKVKKFGKKPGKEMIQYIDSKIKQYL